MTPRATPIKPSESFLGFMAPPLRMVEVNLTSDAGAMADNDVAFEAQEIANAVRKLGGCGYIEAVTLIDIGDNGTDLDLVFFDSAPATLGTENAVVSISDAQVVKALGHISILTTDYCDLVANQIATKALAAPIPVKAVAASTSLYVGGIVRSGTPTYPATGTILRIFIRDA